MVGRRGKSCRMNRVLNRSVVLLDAIASIVVRLNPTDPHQSPATAWLGSPIPTHMAGHPEPEDDRAGYDSP